MTLQPRETDPCYLSSVETALRKIGARQDQIDRYLLKFRRLVETMGLSPSRAFARIYHRVQTGLGSGARRVRSLSIPDLDGCTDDET